MVPGSNLYKLAAKVIAQQTVGYHRFISRDDNVIGLDVAKYAPVKDIRGSFQPVPRNLYEKLGLDFQNSYFTLYAARDILDIQRDVSGDQITFCNEKYQVLSLSGDWFHIDGWVGVLCVKVGNKDAG